MGQDSHLIDTKLLKHITEAAVAGKAAPSQETLAGYLNCCQTTVVSALNRLRAKNIIEVEQDGNARRYWIVERRICTRFTNKLGRPCTITGQLEHNRNCLTCRAPFYSEGKHNRICSKCKTGSEVNDIGGFGTRQNGAYFLNFIP